jgi:hypothetical protein
MLDSTWLLKSMTDLLSTLGTPNFAIAQGCGSASSPAILGSFMRLTLSVLTVGLNVSGGRPLVLERGFASDLESQVNSVADLRSAFALISAWQLPIESGFSERMEIAEKALRTLGSQSGNLQALATESAGIGRRELKGLRVCQGAAEEKQRQTEAALFSVCERLDGIAAESAAVRLHFEGLDPLSENPARLARELKADQADQARVSTEINARIESQRTELSELKDSIAHLAQSHSILRFTQVPRFSQKGLWHFWGGNVGKMSMTATASVVALIPWPVAAFIRVRRRICRVTLVSSHRLHQISRLVMILWMIRQSRSPTTRFVPSQVGR